MPGSQRGPERYLLLVPLRSSPSLEGLEPDTVPDAPTSRSSSSTDILRQSWSALKPQTIADPSARKGSVEFTRAAVSTVRGRQIAALEASRLSGDEGSSPDSEEIECILSGASVSYLTSQLQLSATDVMWVGRYSLDDEQPAGWLSPGTIIQPLHTGHGAELTNPEISVGWGNGAIHGWRDLTESDRMQVVRGLVDAQCIWSECHSIAADALAAIRSLDRPSVSRVTARGLRNEQHNAELLSASLVDHNLAIDDLLLNMQGVRSEAARTALTAWGYDEVSARVKRRVDDVLALLQLRRERFERRFQSTVENVLFAVGLLTLIQFPLSLIATAFTGPVAASPGTGSAMGIFSWLRTANADVIFLASLAIAALVALVVEKRRRS